MSTDHDSKFKKNRWKISLEDDAKERFALIAKRLGIPVATLANITLTELSYLRPEGYFEAMAAIPGHLKARPVGRPAGTTKARKNEQTAAVA